MITPENIREIIGSDGIFAKRLKDQYEVRQQQLDMSLAIADTFNNNKLLLVEAGTGVGKTMAYLTPILFFAREGLTTVISTNTIALQSQLITKDLPAIFDKEDISYALVKGRGNYVCLSEVDSVSGSLFYYNDPSFQRFLKWLKKTTTGDREDISFDFPFWSDVKSDAHICRRDECTYYNSNRCFYYNMRKKAEDALVVVTNHALFFSDLALKLENNNSPIDDISTFETNMFAGVLPEYSAVVFDEAHHLEEVAGNVFGYELNNISIPYIVKRLKKRKDFELSEAVLDSVEEISNDLFNNIQTIKPDYFLDEVANDIVKDNAKKLSEYIDVILEELNNKKNQKNIEKETKSRIDSYIDKLSETKNSINHIFFDNSKSYFRWGEQKNSEHIFFSALHSTPISISQFLGENLFARNDLTFVLTSATLGSSNGFEYIKSRLGIDIIEDQEKIEELMLDSPFNYKEQMLLYVPKDTPQPTDSQEYANLIAKRIRELIDITKGGAFLLFTSYSMLNKVFEILKDDKEFVFLRQGEMSNQQLLKEFKENTNICLMGTSSFWEGVDIPGQQLRLVIIDKIPFSVPTNPTVKAKCDYAEEHGHNAFKEISLPEAIIKLKQGMGRLIRTKEDKGIVAIMDSRLHAKFYRFDIFNSIPRCKGVTKTESIIDWAAVKLNLENISIITDKGSKKKNTLGSSTPGKRRMQYSPDMTPEEKRAYFKKINALKKAKKQKEETD